MSCDDLAIRARNLGKCYHIYARPEDRLKQAIFRGRRPFYREFWAVRDVSLDIPRGETLGIVGRNGSGKSTLLQLLCGTIAPTAGEIRVNGRVAAILELASGFHGEFTGRENVFMNASILGLTQAQISVRFDAIAAFADIGAFIEQPVKTYSSGMLVRLAFSVIAHVDANVLVIDEALAVGDIFFVQKCMRFLRGFQEAGGTIVLVSHDAAAVISLCTRALWMDAGSIRAIGKPKQVLQDYLAAAHGFPAPAKVPAALPVPAASRDSPPPSDAPVSGAGGATVLSVRLCNGRDEPVAVVSGGEQVTLAIKAQANRAVFPIILGFFVKDRLGQNLFGDNTQRSYSAQPVGAQPQQQIAAHFSFVMPTLPAGDYTITIGLAEGTQQDHILQHWVHDACAFHSITRNDATGLVGIPMTTIHLQAGGSADA